MKRPAGLTALFWRYLITTGVAMLLLAVLWWIGLTTMIRFGIVYPANTAAGGVDTVIQSLSSGELETSEIPYYYRWAVFDADSRIQDQGNMDQRHLDYARAALAGERNPQGILYSQYHRVAQLPNGTTCVIQYDYSMPYGAEVLQRRLPEFQTCAMVVLLAFWLLAGAISTRHFAGLLRRDAALLSDATKAIAQRRLDLSITGQARVREFGDTLAAMDDLRQNLAQSLESQWGMEQQRRLELAALTHDLKTPLSVISGNAELLGEDALTPDQRESVDAILRNALRVQDYVAQLRAMTGPDAVPSREKETVTLPELAEGWWEMGQCLCGTKQVTFRCSEVPCLESAVYRGGFGSGGEQSAGQCSTVHTFWRNRNAIHLRRRERFDYRRGRYRPWIFGRGAGPWGAGLLHQRYQPVPGEPHGDGTIFRWTDRKAPRRLPTVIQHRTRCSGRIGPACVIKPAGCPIRGSRQVLLLFSEDVKMY